MLGTLRIVDREAVAARHQQLSGQGTNLHEMSISIVLPFDSCKDYSKVRCSIKSNDWSKACFHYSSFVLYHLVALYATTALYHCISLQSAIYQASNFGTS